MGDPEDPQAAAAALGVRALATGVLGIDDDARLDEMDELAGLLDVISNGMQRLRTSRPEEPPPTTAFSPDVHPRDFWRGRPYVG